ncbi:hypothetical protein [uncultured Desulfobacter sp.]|uniref:hypothetical protein n=1 Tax=uncultured Desulfobacter sp. TaxID=240139 RepID=UPI002AABC50E|nr:hypothetical protein [uncultured Desulfobacter sp.]
MPNPYPALARELTTPKSQDANPAIQLFGRRFFSDQTIPELLIELLLVATAPKKIADFEVASGNCFPGIDTLKNWPENAPLAYAPKSRLNLKLFSLLGASKLETRHHTHIDHYKELIKGIGDSIELSGGINRRDVLKTMENLFLGLQRVGGQRTWCAQSFLPICQQLISGETLWKSTMGDQANDWSDLIEQGRFTHFFSSNQHRFLARGGEALYLQICNALRTSQNEMNDWLKSLDCRQNEGDEVEAERLRTALSLSLNQALQSCPEGLGRLASFIDQGVDRDTQRGTDTDKAAGGARYAECGWCPEETWKEGYLFAVDLLRICQAKLDPVERLTLMETACAMQVLRTICAQSSRYDEGTGNTGAGPLGYVWAISDPDGRDPILKRISQRSVTTTLFMIQRALRCTEIKENVAKQQGSAGSQWTDPYKEADTRYGHKLFQTLSKRLGFMVPRRGPGARFVLTDHLLRYLVLTIVRPGERMTYDSFLDQIFLRVGIALSGKHLNRACEWSSSYPPAAIGEDTGQWLTDMLEGAGVLVRLSDSCSMVENPLGNGRA